MAAKETKTPCWANGESRVVAPYERMRGYIKCPDCAKEFKVSLTTKTKIIPRHNKV